VNEYLVKAKLHTIGQPLKPVGKERSSLTIPTIPPPPGQLLAPTRASLRQQHALGRGLGSVVSGRFYSGPARSRRGSGRFYSGLARSRHRSGRFYSWPCFCCWRRRRRRGLRLRLAHPGQGKDVATECIYLSIRKHSTLFQNRRAHCVSGLNQNAVCTPIFDPRNLLRLHDQCFDIEVPTAQERKGALQLLINRYG